MTYCVATHFDQSNWDKFGLSWLRKAKSEKLKGYIFGKSLNDEAKAKISELGFEYLPWETDDRLSGIVNLNMSCLLTRYNCLPIGDLPNADVVCSTSAFDLIEMARPVANLINRAKVICRIEDENIENQFLSSKFILGSKEFWQGFFSFQNYLKKQQYFDFSNDDLFFNLYLSFFKSFDIKLYTNAI